MLPFSSLQARIYSKMGMRGCFALAMEDLAENDPSLMVLTADLATLTGLSRFTERYPHMFLNVGIAEQNMIGIASGLAKEGMNVFVTTYANFLSMRAYEQIRIQIAYMGLKAAIVGTGSGLAMGMSGNTHYGIEDIALMRAIPGMTVISPADGFETMKAVMAVSTYQNPVYLRLCGGLNVPVVYKDEYQFTIGNGVLLSTGEQIAIIATGTMVHESLIAAQLLRERGVFATVINMHTIKPLDTEIIAQKCLQSTLIVTIEEHIATGGLGGAVSEYLSGFSHHPRLIRIGLPDRFQTVGDYAYLLKENGLTGQQIADRIFHEFTK